MVLVFLCYSFLAVLRGVSGILVILSCSFFFPVWVTEKKNYKKRLLRNRVSAQQARERKKAYLNDLETKVKDLEKKNSELEERLSTLQNENQMLRHVCQTHHHTSSSSYTYHHHPHTLSFSCYNCLLQRAFLVYQKLMEFLFKKKKK